MTSSTPPTDPGPEYLERGGGAPIGRDPKSTTVGRRKLLLAGVAVVGLGAVGAGVWAAASFLATGAQPDEALPASTLGYASIDLDPSGGQKIEAFEVLRKFPAFRDKVGLDAEDDIKKYIFDKAGLADECPGLDYESDLEPWLGDRAAVAAVELDEEPVPVAVLQVTDADAAATGLATLGDCGGGQPVGWEIDGEWAVVAETAALAREVAAETAKGALAEDPDYRQWTGEVGDAGVLNLYAAPEAGDYLADHLGDLFPVGPMMGMSGAGSSGVGPGSAAYSSEVEVEPELPDEMLEGLRNFRGMAATLRFDDGALELESVGDAAALRQSYYDTEAGDDVLASLPADTAAALGVGFADGWGQQLLDEVTRSLGGGEQAEAMVRQAEQWTGLELPEDLETLFGDSTVLAVGADFNPEGLEDGTGPGDIPIGLKVRGDAAEVERVLDKIRTRLGAMGAPLRSRADGDVVAVGPSDAYLAKLLEDGALGDSAVFQDVVRESERSGVILFVNFDAGGDWLAALAEDREAAANLEPLEAFGVSSWQDGDTAHGMMRVTTD
jgi:Protein of unknown function (DUF3352)